MIVQVKETAVKKPRGRLEKRIIADLQIKLIPIYRNSNIVTIRDLYAQNIYVLCCSRRCKADSQHRQPMLQPSYHSPCVN